MCVCFNESAKMAECLAMSYLAKILEKCAGGRGLLILAAVFMGYYS